MTLVIAPAGAGKTSLLSAWATESTIPVCWLSLDEADQDVGVLWFEIMSSLESAAPEHRQRMEGHRRPMDSPLDMLDDLLEVIDRELSTPTILVLDDVHLADSASPVAESLSAFLQHVPALLHVVVLSRRVPRLPLDRLRAHGRLSEVHLTELLFSPSEAAEMLVRLSPSLSEEQVTATVQMADGWAAGIQLAALASRSGRAINPVEPPSAAANVLIHDYIWREVFAREDPELVAVMSDVAVVERVEAGLARALTGRADASDLLQRAEERGLFVSRLKADGCFEVHALVRTTLLEELARTSPDHIRRQHVAAAKWFESSNDVASSLEHWLLAEDYRSALRLLAARHADLYDSGRESTLRRFIEAIPLATATEDLEAMLEFAWCHLLISRRRFVELVDQLVWWVKQWGCDEGLCSRVTMLESIAATVSGNWVKGGALARQALDAMGESWWRDPLGRFGWNMVAREIALTDSWDDGAYEVRQAELSLGRDAPRRVAFEGTRVLGEALAGWPVDAIRVAAGVRGTVASEHMTILDAELTTGEAIARREMGDKDRALLELEALAEAPAETMLYCRVLALVELVQAHLDSGDRGEANRRFAQAEELMEVESFGTDGRELLARVGVRLALSEGDTDRARRWALSIVDNFWRHLSIARVQMADGDRAGALAALDAADPRCPRHEVVLALTKAQILDDHEAVLDLVTKAVEQAVAFGILQSVVSEGPEVVQLVERVAGRVPQLWMDRLRRAVVDGAPLDVQVRDQRLTERERDVLRFLPSRLTLSEIARELYISPNTLKFHLKVIYRKLGVNSRAQAAELTRHTTPTSKS